MADCLKPISSAHPWGEREARHLLNRAGFGVPQSAIEKLAAMGPARAVAAMVNYEQFPGDAAPPDFLSSREEVAGRMLRSAGASEEERMKARRELAREQRQQMQKLKLWWLDRMRNTSRPLQEKMALFWHGHFATSAEKVKLPLANYELNEIFRASATGNFKSLVFQVGKSPAMLQYLDNRQNRKGHPNENWARELMELFTLGIGHYTEADIKEGARAFTGYTERGGEFRFVSNQHDFGEKTFLGKTGKFDGADAINIIFEQPQAARHISRKLWEYFVYEGPDEESVEELATVLRENDYELKPLLEKVFYSQEFYSPRAMEGQIKSPAQYMVMLTDHIGLKPQQGMLVTLAMRVMGQDLFYPPNVKGWDGGRAWINTNSLLTRYNIPGYLLTGERPNLVANRRLDEMGDERAGRMKRMPERARSRFLAAIQKRMGLDVKALWEPLDGLPPGEAVDRAVSHLTGRSPLPRQREILLASLGKTARLDVNNTDVNNLSGTLHLILSMAEYQLC